MSALFRKNTERSKIGANHLKGQNVTQIIFFYLESNVIRSCTNKICCSFHSINTGSYFIRIVYVIAGYLASAALITV